MFKTITTLLALAIIVFIGINYFSNKSMMGGTSAEINSNSVESNTSVNSESESSFFRNIGSTQTTSQNTQTNTETNSNTNANAVVEVDTKNTIVSTEIKVATTIKDDPLVKKASLIAVDGSTSYGTAYIVRKDGKLMHRIEASLPNPKTGNKYEGWLVQPGTKPIKFFSTGVMTRNSDGSWVLEYEANMEYTAYNNIVITEETKIDKTPEKHILEGSFK